MLKVIAPGSISNIGRSTNVTMIIQLVILYFHYRGCSSMRSLSMEPRGILYRNRCVYTYIYIYIYIHYIYIYIYTHIVIPQQGASGSIVYIQLLTVLSLCYVFVNNTIQLFSLLQSTIIRFATISLFFPCHKPHWEAHRRRGISCLFHVTSLGEYYTYMYIYIYVHTLYIYTYIYIYIVNNNNKRSLGEHYHDYYYYHYHYYYC